MVSISDLYTDLMSLLNQGFYTKNESDNHYISKDIEAYLDTDTGKLYVTLDEQASLTLNNSNVEVGTGDTITLTTTLLDKNNNGIPYVRVEFKKGSTVIGTGVTNNNGVATLSYTVVETDNFMVSASTRYLHSSNLNITISQLNQIKLGILVNENTCFYDDEAQGYVLFDGLGGGLGVYEEEGEYELILTDWADTHMSAETFMDCDWLVSFDASECPILQTMGGDVFYRCNNLKEIIFSPSQTSITKLSNYYCPNLESITFLTTTPPNVAPFDLDSLSQSCVIHIPQGTYSAYTSAEYYPDPNIYTYIEY